MEEVTCELRYPRLADVFLALAAGATVALVALAGFPEPLRALLWAWTAGGALLARATLRRPTALRLASDGGIEVREAHAVRAGRVVPGSFVAPWLTVVHWRPEGARLRRTLLLLPGAAPAEALRQIRVILRFG